MSFRALLAALHVAQYLSFRCWFAFAVFRALFGTCQLRPGFIHRSLVMLENLCGGQLGEGERFPLMKNTLSLCHSHLVLMKEPKGYRN